MNTTKEKIIIGGHGGLTDADKGMMLIIVFIVFWTALVCFYKKYFSSDDSTLNSTLRRPFLSESTDPDVENGGAIENQANR